MKYAVDILIITALFILFAVPHSVLASIPVKKWFKENFKKLLPFYRLSYNIISVISFLLFWRLAPKPPVIIYDLYTPWDMIILIPQFAALGLIIWSGKYFDLKEFLGLAQIIRWKEDSYNYDDLDEQSDFRIEGPYKYSRHPIYFYFILLLGFRPVMSLFYLTGYILIVIYFYVGSIYEEKKMVRMFGDRYREYQNDVPRMIPVKFKRIFS